MEKELTEDEVDRFLLRNPKFVKSWLSGQGLGDVSDDLYGTTGKGVHAANTFIEFIEHILFQKKIARKGHFENFTENEMFKEILKVLNSEFDVGTICHKVLQNICILLRCERASLFMARGTGKTQYLISTLFDVTTESVLEETLHTEENAIRIPFGKGISGFVAQNKCLVNIKDVYNDPRFVDDVDKKTGFRTKSILCLPMLNNDNNLIGVAEVMNKRCDKYFDTEDEHIFASFLSFCCISMDNFHFFEKSFEEYKRHKLLLQLNQCILKHQNCLPKLISEIIKLAMEMLYCESISVYLIDPKRGIYCPTESSKVFQLLKGASDITEEFIEPKVRNIIEQNINSGNTLDVINLNDSDKFHTINLESEIESWLLCLAIKDACQNFVGWIVFVRNSLDVFSQNDINMMEMFTMFCGLAIYNCRLYETATNMLSQLEFTNNILSNHTTCDAELVYHFLDMELKSSSYYQIHLFEFNDFLYSEEDTVLLCVRIFLEARTLPILCISVELLYRWILTVKKNYRPVTYHNWRHAINVTQTMFSMLTTGKLQIYFTEFEQICLLIACLCHDLDHRGHNNAFQLKTASPLATLYSTSIMENHHIDRCIRILNNTDTNIFQNIPSEKYQQGLKLIEKAILATDLVIYFERRNIFKRKIEVDDKTLESSESIDLLISMMMTASDLSAITKPWDVQRKTAMKVAAEFFEQGDLESNFKYTVLPMMDRRKRYEIPKMQVGFIDFVCTTVYKLLSEVHDHLKPMYDGMMNNRVHWSDIANGKEEFDVDKEFELVLHNISVEDNILPKQSLLPCKLQATVSTQTILTFHLKQKNIQTDISIPTDINQQKIVSNPAKMSIKAVETNTVGSQTENLLQNVTSVKIQTDRPSSGSSGQLLIVMPHEQRLLNLETSRGDITALENKSLQKKSHSSHIRPTVEIPTIPGARRKSWLDALTVNTGKKLVQKRRDNQGTGVLNEEKSQQIRRMTHVYLPPNPVRQKQTSPEQAPYQNSTDSFFKQSIESVTWLDALQMSSQENPSNNVSTDSLGGKQISTEEKIGKKRINSKGDICQEITTIPQVPCMPTIQHSSFRKRKCMKIIPKTKQAGKGGLCKHNICVIS